MATSAVAVVETLKAADRVAMRLAWPVALLDRVILRDVAQARGRRKAAVSDRLKLRVSATPAARLTVTLRDGVAVRGRLVSGLHGRIAERLAVRGRLTGAQRVVLREVMRLRAGGSFVASRRVLMRSGLRLADTLNHGRGAALLDGLRLTPRAQAVYEAVVNLVDGMALTEAVEHRMVVTILLQEDVELSSATLLRGLYHGHLRDTLDFILDVVDPLGDTTTWAMNARTNGITEYLNYGFNAFAQSANGTYLAAGDDGLYELAGPDDAGDPVLADVVSGLASFSGVFLSGLQAAYIGIRGKGEFFLKLTSGDGRSTTYAVKVQSMKTARVNLGKGWRARYMTWELVSTGQDFDLLDVTFLPIQNTRRI